MKSSEWNEIEKEVELCQSREIESWNEFEREVRLRENEDIGSKEEEPTSEGNYDDRWDELEGEEGLQENEGIPMRKSLQAKGILLIRNTLRRSRK
jgi:hypothetical protein